VYTDTVLVQQEHCMSSLPTASVLQTLVWAVQCSSELWCLAL
jgi:hypothetical protein